MVYFIKLLSSFIDRLKIKTSHPLHEVPSLQGPLDIDPAGSFALSPTYLPEVGGLSDSWSPMKPLPLVIDPDVHRRGYTLGFVVIWYSH